MLDNYNQKFATSDGNAALAGRMDKDLTFAITAAQSLNDTQKQKVQNFLFIFQEYYNSASSILQALNNLAQKIADAIGR